MIQEIDQALRALIRAEAFADRDVEVVFDAPTKEWAGRRNAPTVDVYLYDIREDMRRRARGVENEYDGNGRIVGRHLPPRHFKLSYLVTAWTQRPEDEHRLLSALLACFLRHDAIPPELLTSPLSDLGLPVPLSVGLPPPEDRAFADVWSALGGELKPSLDVVITAPTDTGQRRETGPPVVLPPKTVIGGQDGWPAQETRTVAAGPCRRRTVVSELARSPVNAAGVGLGHLFARVALVEARVRAMVEHRRRDDPAPDDPFRGLYLTDDDVDRLLAARAPGPPRDDEAVREVEQACTAAGTPSRLRELQRACGLSDLDVEILLAALVPDLDARFERLYGYLNDDVTRRRATIGLALEIGAARPTAVTARRRLTAGAPLLHHLLVTVEDPERPFLSRGLRVPDRVTAHLLGGDDPDAALTDLLADITPAPGSLADDLGRVLTDCDRSGHDASGSDPPGVPA